MTAFVRTTFDESTLRFRSRLRAFGVGVALCGALGNSYIFAQSAPANISADNKPPDSISGLVINSATGRPLNTARIILTKRFERTIVGETVETMTDASGRFQFFNLEPGDYELHAMRNGYAPQAQFCPVRPSDGKQLNKASLLRLASRDRFSVVIRLTAQAVVSGRVLDEDRMPLSDAAIQLRRVGSGSSPTGGMAGREQTDDQGRFRLFGIEPGRYTLVVTPPRRPTDRDRTHFESAKAYVPTYYPGVVNESGAVVMTLTSGQEQDVEMILPKAAIVDVAGRCESPETEPYNGVVLLYEEKAAGYYRSARLEPTGNWQIKDVVSGAYILAADVRIGDRRFYARIPLNVESSSLEGVTLSLRPRPNLPGQTQVEGDATSLPNLKIGLVPRQKRHAAFCGPVAVGKDGAFVLTDTCLDLSDVVITGLPDGYFIKSARLGSRDVLESGIDLSRPEDRQGKSEKLDVVISSSGGKIEGIVSDPKNEASPGARVFLIRFQEGATAPKPYRIASADANGRFNFSSLPPGKYMVVASSFPEEGGDGDLAQETLAKLAAQGVWTTLDERSRASVHVHDAAADQPAGGPGQ